MTRAELPAGRDGREKGSHAVRFAPGHRRPAAHPGDARRAAPRPRRRLERRHRRARDVQPVRRRRPSDRRRGDRLDSSRPDHPGPRYRSRVRALRPLPPPGPQCRRTLPSLLDEFATLRRRISTSCGAGGSRTRSSTGRGVHPRLGPVTLRQLLAAWVVHDLGHIAQVTRVMAKQYREAIGPWVPFLPVVSDRPAPVS